MSRVITRRRWLQLAGAAVAGSSVAARLYAAPPSGARFLLVFLRGGYDATNALIPYSSSFYYEARPTIAIPGRTRRSAAVRWPSTRTGRWRQRCAIPSVPCINSVSLPSYPSPAPRT